MNIKQWLKSSKHYITAIIFLIIIAISLGFMFAQPITIEYIELDGHPGLGGVAYDIDISLIQQDVWLSITKGWQLESYTKYPNYVAALIVCLVLSTTGFAVSIWQWEKDRE